MKRLLILSCSKKKKSDPELLPAIERYDGPTFRVLRRFIKLSSKMAIPSVFILSSKYGLIAHNELIPNYNNRITPQRAQELQVCATAKLNRVLRAKRHQNLPEHGMFVCLGKDYFPVIDAAISAIKQNEIAKVANGSLGKRLADLHDWLYSDSPMRRRSVPIHTYEGKAFIKGVEIVMTVEQALDIARHSLSAEFDKATNYQSWYVLVDGERVSPKWLVSQISGLPVSAFHTDAARRTLQDLGIQVYTA
ncbi:MAG: DUF6884 domain-containing protein [Pyrinomonadaceae bacterium]